jgi:transcriptional regulator with XRE-family HTH domain
MQRLRLRLVSLPLNDLRSRYVDRCGFARSYMIRIERGMTNLSLDAIETLAGGLKVSVKSFED